MVLGSDRSWHMYADQCWKLTTTLSTSMTPDLATPVAALGAVENENAICTQEWHETWTGLDGHEADRDLCSCRRTASTQTRTMTPAHGKLASNFTMTRDGTAAVNGEVLTRRAGGGAGLPSTACTASWSWSGG